MKKLLVLLTIVSLGIFSSCSSDESSEGGNDFTIAVTSDFVTRYTGEDFTFTVKKNDGTNVTSEAIVSVNNTAISGNVFNSAVAGTFTVKATYGGKTSSNLTVIVTNAPAPLTAIAVTSSSASVDPGQALVFTVTGNNATNVTNTSTIYVNGVAITGSSYTPTTYGTLDVYAVHTNGTGTFTSPTIQVVVNQVINFNKRVLIEDFTGTWCGYCPRVSHAISLTEQQTTDAVVVAIHRGSDPYNFSGASALESQIGLQGYPTAMLNRTTEWGYPEPSHVNQAVALTTGINPKMGIAMNTSVSGNTATVEVKAKFGASFSNLKLVVYAVEDNLTYNQTNYTSYYGGASTIANFDHDNVLRGVLTSSILGETIPGSFVVSDEYTQSFTYNIPANVNTTNLRFVAFVIDSTKKALNSRAAGPNESQAFEIE
nr:Omp28-related outer membrane protein [uncultured Flavobacterium sp.]